MRNNKIRNFDSVERYNPDFKYGLTEAQVTERSNAKLFNTTKVAVGKSYSEIIFTNVFSLFNIILYIIAGLMIYGRYYDGLFFLLVLIPNICIGLYEDLNARRLMGKLKLLTAPKAKVIRDGVEKEIQTQEIVLDDVVVLSQSNQICVDGVVLNGSISVNESFLTGESQNIYKNVGDEIYSGSYVVSGKAYVKASKVGPMCYIEQLQGKANKFKRSASQILSSLRRMFRCILVMVVTMAAAMLITYGLQGKLSTNAGFIKEIGPISGSLVSMIPSGLYLLTSVALATTVMTLATKKAQVQDFYSVEMLARVNVLCVDKTGTITDGNMKVKQVVPLIETLKEDQISQIVSNLLIATQDENITAKALKEYFDYELTAKITASLPFNSENKYSAASFSSGKTYILGAAEFMNVENKQALIKATNEFTLRGFRVLVLAESYKPITNNKVEDVVKPIGFIVLEDHIRPDAIETFKWFKENKVAVKVISGDNAQTVSEVAKAAGIENAERYISLEGMGIQQVKSIANQYTVFGRVSPEQKEALILSLKESGNTVGMTGDGVNDILALKRADCSIAMASGAEAARNVSHIVLLDSNFDHLPEVVGEGRRIINNLQRTCSLFLVKTTFAFLTSLIFLIWSLSLFKGTSYPFRTNHLYLWETLSIGVAAFFLALQPNKELIEGSFVKNILSKAIPIGIFAVIAAILPFIMIVLQQNNILYLDVDSFDVATGIAVISFSLFGLLSLGKVCYPFDKYRTIVFGCTMLGDIILFVYGLIMTLTGNYDWSIVKIRFDLLSPLNYFEGIIIFLFLGILYIGGSYIVKVIRKEKHNESIK